MSEYRTELVKVDACTVVSRKVRVEKAPEPAPPPEVPVAAPAPPKAKFKGKKAKE